MTKEQIKRLDEEIESARLRAVDRKIQAIDPTEYGKRFGYLVGLRRAKEIMETEQGGEND